MALKVYSSTSAPLGSSLRQAFLPQRTELHTYDRDISVPYQLSGSDIPNLHTKKLLHWVGQLV